MIALLLAVQLTTVPSMTTVTYRNVPPDVARISLFRWTDNASPVQVAGDVERQGNRVRIRAAPGLRRLVLLERADGVYLLDGPFWWPATDVERALDTRWRRTIAVRMTEPIDGLPAFEWLSGSPDREAGWPRCFQSGERLWACWGAVAGEPGVIVCRALDRTWWMVVSRGAASSLRSSKWGRLLVVPDVVAEGSELRIRFARPVPSSSQRARGVRVDTTTVAGAESASVAPGVAWLSGEEVPKDAWVDVRTIRAGPAYLSLQDVADGPSSIPLTLQLDETRAVGGLAIGAREQRASGALVTLFRLIDPPAPPNSSSREKPRRVLAAETTADAAGVFHLEGIGEAEYEIVAWHPQLGRVAAALPRRAGTLTLRLESPGTVRGRIVAAGKPVRGVDVISLPGPDAVRTADDIVDVKGGDTRTGEDGRFVVMLAASGGGELRVGGGTYPIKRIPLPREPAPLLDLGDIDLGAPLEITIVLDQDSACDLRATGPVGQTGLQIVAATRTGPGLFRMVLPEQGLWAFGLLCGLEERALVPPAIQISPAHAGKEVRFSVR